MMGPRIYLDHNATSPLRPEAREAMLAALDVYGNPSSIHNEGRAARAIVESARDSVAQIFSVKPSQVYFTSGGTEAANWLLNAPALAGAALKRLVISPVEHPCVLRGHGFPHADTHTVPVNADGSADLEWLDRTLRDMSPCAVAIQAANSETGVLQPLGEIAEIARSHDSVFISDAVQAVGRLPEDALHAPDAIFFSAHKFGGPKGVGAVILNSRNLTLTPFLRGGGQERRQRSGTENVAGIAGLAAALKTAVASRDSLAERLLGLRQTLETGIRGIAADAAIFGENTPRLPNTTCLAVPGLSAEMALIAFDLDGVAVSSGSACSSGKVERSHVLEAMGVKPHLCEGAIRVSAGWNSAGADIERFLAVLSKLCSHRRGLRAA